jgi:magnesium-transporting ATPase (P-type)
MTVGLALVGVVFLLIEKGALTPAASTGWLATTGLVFFIAAFAIGPGICVWLAESELLPLRIRANAMMTIGFVQMGSSWLLAQLFLPWSERFGESSVFFALSVVCIVFFATAVVFLPETKGKTLEEIECHFAGGCRK